MHNESCFPSDISEQNLTLICGLFSPAAVDAHADIFSNPGPNNAIWLRKECPPSPQQSVIVAEHQGPQVSICLGKTHKVPV